MQVSALVPNLTAADGTRLTDNRGNIIVASPVTKAVVQTVPPLLMIGIVVGLALLYGGK